MVYFRLTWEAALSNTSTRNDSIKAVGWLPSMSSWRRTTLTFCLCDFIGRQARLAFWCLVSACSSALDYSSAEILESCSERAWSWSFICPLWEDAVVCSLEIVPLSSVRISSFIDVISARIPSLTPASSFSRSTWVRGSSPLPTLFEAELMLSSLVMGLLPYSLALDAMMMALFSSKIIIRPLETLYVPSAT